MLMYSKVKDRMIRHAYDVKGVSGRALRNQVEIDEKLPVFIMRGGKIRKISPAMPPERPSNPVVITGWRDHG